MTNKRNTSNISGNLSSVQLVDVIQWQLLVASCDNKYVLEIVSLANKYNLEFSFNINKKLLQNDLKKHISDRNLPKNG